LHGEDHFVTGIQFGLVIVGDDAQFQNMFAWLKAIQSAAITFEHAHQFTVDIGVGVVAAFAFGQLEVQVNPIAGDGLIIHWRDDLHARPLSRLQRRCLRRWKVLPRRVQRVHPRRDHR